MTVETPIAVNADAFAARFRELMQESRFNDLGSDTQRAKALGISKGLYSQWKNGRTALPEYPKVSAVCRKLGARPEWLLREDGPKYLSTDVGPASTPSHSGNEVEALQGHTTMNLQQQKTAMSELLDNMSHTTRQDLLEMAAREALRRGDIKQVPSWMMSPEWNAAHKIDQLAKQTKSRKPGRHDQ